ncbi:permease prefix domain 1-containing protein [Pseudalkalibacillus sp. JSM 102089]|uniref:permease prefix domain 1-containing protein n=1 Tax=Pseudalkalibacillus sp. JSM 102089 TaxID=3229856 RepID=UPI0035252461
MKQIDEFVNSIYENVSGKEAKELKQEMRSHIVEAVEELKLEGKSEQEAISIALERFGDEKQITKGLLTIFQYQNKFAKWLMRSAIAILLIGLVVSISLTMKDNTYRETSDLMSHVVKTYENKGKLNADDKRALKDMVERNSEIFNNISYFAVVKNTEEEGDNTSKKLFLQGREGIGESGLMRQGVAEDNTWYVEWEYANYDFLKYEPFYYIFFAISGVLFILWRIVHYYNRTRFKAFV